MDLTRHTRAFVLACLGATAATLTACGGGGGGSSTVTTSSILPQTAVVATPAASLSKSATPAPNALATPTSSPVGGGTAAPVSTGTPLAAIPGVTIATPAATATAKAVGPTAAPVATPQPIVVIPVPTPIATSTAASSAVVRRSAFVGAFYRPQGAPPFGVFSAQGAAPQPYPPAGSNNYCTQTAANGASISGSNTVDPTKLSNLVNLGVKWTRFTTSSFNDDLSHVFGPGSYSFADIDSAQCATLVARGIAPVVGLEAGPVQYNSTVGTFSPTSYPTYQSASDFGAWCGAVAAHEQQAFGVAKFSLPGNEVNTNPQLFPGGNPQIAAYSKACYTAIKAANPTSFVYGFELNMDGQANATAFVQQMYALGCKIGTCYDGIAMHLSLRYPVPPAGTPCFPNAGGDYSMQCVNDIQNAAQSPAMHVLISEMEFTVPGSVPDEATKAKAVSAAFAAYATNASVDGVSYANIDECASYQSGYFANGCLITSGGTILPAYGALQTMATQYFN